MTEAFQYFDGISQEILFDNMKKEVPIWEKSNLTLEEASAYFGIGRVLFICQEGAIMAIERRKDNKNRVLKEREYQSRQERSNHQ